MKKIYRKEEGVSPVIATILMVAITVVLAATVYIMVAGLGGGGGTTPLSAGLQYLASQSDSHNAVLQVSMSNPSTADFASIKITIKNGTTTNTATLGADGTGSTTVGSITYNIKVLDLDNNGKLNTGDQIVITSSGGEVGGVTVLMYITGYSGSAQTDIPA